MEEARRGLVKYESPGEAVMELIPAAKEL
jgi:hypothetical protein